MQPRSSRLHPLGGKGVVMLLCKKIKIEVSAEGAEALEWMQGKCRALYNWWIMRLRSGEVRWNLKRAKQSLRESKVYDPELRFVYGKLLAEVYYRLDGAMQAFFRRVAEGEQKPGFPRVKPRHQFFTLCYPAMYLDKIEGHTIILPTGGLTRVGFSLTQPEKGPEEEKRGEYSCQVA